MGDVGLPVTLKLSFTTDYVVHFSNLFLICYHEVESQQSADGRQKHTPFNHTLGKFRGSSHLHVSE